ncbi:MAG: hypothetical protein M3Y44_17875 [Actinomycetota bacterium]|nr:hypothetical protein [Actinomycetota bacterium]
MRRDERSREKAGDRIAASSIGVPDSDRLEAFLDDLRSLAGGAPPAPSAELEAILGGGVSPVGRALRPRRHRNTIAGALIMGSIGAGLSGAAAAEDRPASPAPHVQVHVVPGSAPDQRHPVGGRVPSLPEPRRPRLDPVRAARQVAPTPAAPTGTNQPAPSGDGHNRSTREPQDRRDSAPGETPEHHPETTPRADHGTEHDRSTATPSDQPSEIPRT